ncbi:MAG: Wzz/FepE/Etk N-terminal domain-containing protein [Ignavibacteria bacterium]|nr:Wzz/FepE/Etk N-terminal domain-containing protein [Ignavibacteria bacterium]
MKETETKIESIGISKFIEIYRKHSKRIWIIVAIACVVTFIFSLIMPHTYRTYTTVMPPKQGENTGLSGILQNFAGGLPSGLSIPGSSNNQSLVLADILRSRAITEHLIKELHLKKYPQYNGMTHNELIEYLQENFKVDVEKTGLIVFQTSAKTCFFPSSREKQETKQLAKNLADEAVKGLDIIVRSKNTSAAKKSRMYIEKELAKYRGKSDSIDNILENFQRTNRVLKIDDQTQALVKQAIEVGLQLAKAEMELNVAKNELSKDNPYLIQQQNIVNQLRKQYNAVQSGGLTGSDGFSIPFDKIPSLAREYANLYRDKKIVEQIIMYLETQRHQEAIQENRDVPTVEVLDKAYIPDYQSSPNKKLMVLLSFVLSFMLALMYFTLKEFRNFYKKVEKGNEPDQ